MGYRAYLQSHASYQLKKIFDVNALDLSKVTKAFGFKVFTIDLIHVFTA